MSHGRKWGERNWSRYIYLHQFVVESGTQEFFSISIVSIETEVTKRKNKRCLASWIIMDDINIHIYALQKFFSFQFVLPVLISSSISSSTLVLSEIFNFLECYSLCARAQCSHVIKTKYE